MRSSDICQALYAYAREHSGRNLDISLNGVPVLLIQRHEEADHVLRSHVGHYRKNMAWFRQALGASRFSEDGEAWETRRQLTHAYFSHFDRTRTVSLACRHAAVAATRLLAHHGERAPDAVLRQMAVSVLVENFFELPFEHTGIDLERIAELMEYGSAYAFVPAGHTDAMYRDALRRLPALRREVLRELRVFRDGRVPPNPMLQGMLAADSRHAVVLEHELLTFFAAGAETSAATVGWALYLLAAYPDLQRSLREEALSRAEAVAAQGWPALARFESLARFISETLRLYPPTPIVARLAVAPDQLDGRDIAPGQNVLLSFVGIQSDARLLDDPWRPRLDAASHHGVCAGVRQAFGRGPRVCGGKQFAMVELMAFVFTLLRQAEVELTSQEAPRFHWKAQMLREGGQPVRLRPLAG